MSIVQTEMKFITIFVLFLSLSNCRYSKGYHSLYHQVTDIQGKVSISDNFPTNSDNKIEFGTGYNTVTLKPTYNKVVDVEEHVRGPNNGFIESSFKIQLCKSREEFFTKLSGGLSQPASFLGTASSSTEEFLVETNITCLDSIIIASVDAITDTRVAFNAKFTNESASFLKNWDFDGILAKFGTHYLRKIIIGGKMLLVIKFTSNSKKDKTNLDIELRSDVVGIFSGEKEFSDKLQILKEKNMMEVFLYGQGTEITPPHPTIHEGIQYALNFAKNLLKCEVVRDIEYTAIWTIPAAPLGLKQYIIKQQINTDQLVHISVDLMNIEMKISDIQILKHIENAYISDLGWAQLAQTKSRTHRARDVLQEDFVNIPAKDSQNIINDASKIVVYYNQMVDAIVANELKYNYKQVMTLKSAKDSLYISTEDDDYPMVQRNGPVPLYIEEVAGSKTVRYGLSYYYVRSGKHGMHDWLLCMGKNNYYVFWVDYKEDEMCQWRVVHATDRTKRFMEYGDKILLYNRYWPGYIMGVKDVWLGAMKAENHDAWYVGKM